MKNQPRPPGVERRKKPRTPLEVSPPEKPQSRRRTLLLVAAVILAIVGLAGFIAIFWMGASGQL